MSLYFESIRVVRGRIMNLSGHQERVDRCLKANCPDLSAQLSLRKSIPRTLLPATGIYKLRIKYDANRATCEDLQVQAYTEKAIHSLQIVEAPQIIYNHKSENRKELDRLFEQKKQADDILISRGGMLTDTWYCNIALFDGENWFTPASCLLPGTMRSKLLSKKIISEASISKDDLRKYSKIRLFNAMIPWSRKKEIPTNRIYC